MEMDPQNLTILQQQLFNLPMMSSEVRKLFDEFQCNIESMIQSSIEQKNDLKNKKNDLENDLSKYDHLLFLNGNNYNKNESQNIKELSNALINLQYATHKTMREINMEIVSLKCDIEIMEHDLKLYEKNRINLKDKNLYLNDTLNNDEIV